MIKIRTANMDDYVKIRDFYYALIDTMADAEYNPGWEKDIYPTQEYLINSIEEQELYVGEIDHEIVSCMIVNHKYNDGYKEVSWLVEAEDSELYVIHALGVDPIYSGKGIAKQMVRYVLEMARQNQMKSVRLDVLEGNIPAEKAYTKIGFQYLDTMRMFYEDTGWTNYRVFEYPVKY